MGTYNTFFTSELYEVLSLSYILYSYILQFILQYVSVHNYRHHYYIWKLRVQCKT